MGGGWARGLCSGSGVGVGGENSDSSDNGGGGEGGAAADGGEGGVAAEGGSSEGSAEAAAAPALPPLSPVRMASELVAESREERFARVVREQMGHGWEGASAQVLLEQAPRAKVLTGQDGTLWRRAWDGAWEYLPPQADSWKTTMARLDQLPAHKGRGREVDGIPNYAISVQLGPDRQVEFELPENPGVWLKIGDSDFGRAQTEAAGGGDLRQALEEARVLARFDADKGGARALDPAEVAARRHWQAGQVYEPVADDYAAADETAARGEDLTLRRFERLEEEARVAAEKRGPRRRRRSGAAVEDRSKDDGDKVKWQEVQLSVSVSQKPAGAKTINTIQPVVVVGNGNGLVGFGLGGAEDPGDARNSAARRAKRALVYVDRKEARTLWEEVKVKHKRSLVHMWPLPRGYGIRASPVVHKIAQLAGIKDMGCKVRGSMNHKTLVPAILKAMSTPRSPLDILKAQGRPIAKLQPRAQRRLQRQMLASPALAERVARHAEEQRERLAAALGVAPEDVPGRSAAEQAAADVKIMRAARQ